MPGLSASPLAVLDRPFPGLRSFESHEAFLFYGRQDHTEELLRRLAKNHLVAVVGTSGSGKSSLVKAGLLPALYRGYLAGATSQWRIAVLRPGGDPLGELAKALSAPDALGTSDSRELRVTLGRSSMGLIQAVRRAAMPDQESLLIVVDQFEELFRFRQEAPRSSGDGEASLFVALLLQAVEQVDARIYVVLTLRSDFLGDCAQFPQLPDALNRSQYLVPRLTREQRKQAIEEPLRLAGASVSSRLVQRLLNDAGEDPDQLPVLQHALMRMCGRWKETGSTGEIDLQHYEEVGGIEGALDAHANAVFNSLDANGQRLAMKLFRCLTTVEDGREMRRPAPLERIYSILGAFDPQTHQQINDVIMRFADPGDSLLTTTTRMVLQPDSYIDITHESLIRKWAELKRWVKLEAASAEWYRDLVGGVERYEAGDSGLWRDPELARALTRRTEDEWNEAWASQYWPGDRPSFRDVNEFLDSSRKNQEGERQREAAMLQRQISDAVALANAQKRVKRWLIGAIVLLLLLFGSLLLFYNNARTLLETNQQLEAQRINLVDTLQTLIEANTTLEALHRQLDEKEGQLRLTADQNQVERDRLNSELKSLRDEYKKASSRADEAQKLSADAGTMMLQATGAQGTAKAGDSRISNYNRADILIAAQNRLTGVPLNTLAARSHTGDANSLISLPPGWSLDVKLVPPGGCVLQPTHIYNDGRGGYSLSVMTVARAGPCPWLKGEYQFLLSISVGGLQGLALGKIVIN